MVELSILHKVVNEENQVGPNSTTLPLTFLDIHLAGPIYVRSQFFYKFPHSEQHFLQTTLPILKHTLSHTLQVFFPLAGNLICPPEPNKPFIQCTQDDTVTFKIAVTSSSSDFNHLSSNGPKSLNDLDHLVPKLTYKLKDDDNDTIAFPLLALQATVFPKYGGLCIAITYCHVMDARCCDHFMKTWSSHCKRIILGEESSDSSPPGPPCFDRELLKDPRKLEDIFLREYFVERSTWKDQVQNSGSSASSEKTEHVKATIVFSSEDIKRMKKFALEQLNKIDKEHSNNSPQYLSTFVVTCGLVWSTMVKTKQRDNNDDNKEEENMMRDEYFRFAADCTNRLGYRIPKTYFGNCITICLAKLKRMELNNDVEIGFVNAVRVIEKAINDMKSVPFGDAENWKSSFREMFPNGLLVTGSPKFEVYGTDFGFGKPMKVEMKHSLKVMSLAETRDDKGGVEVGLVFRNLAEYQSFKSVLHMGLQKISNS